MIVDSWKNIEIHLRNQIICQTGPRVVPIQFLILELYREMGLERNLLGESN